MATRLLFSRLFAMFLVLAMFVADVLPGFAATRVNARIAKAACEAREACSDQSVILLIAVSHQRGGGRFFNPTSGGGGGGTYSPIGAPGTDRYNPNPDSFLYTPPSTFLETEYGYDENGAAITLVDAEVPTTGNISTDTTALQNAINTALGKAQHTRIRISGYGFEARNLWLTPNTQGNYYLYIEPYNKSFLPAQNTQIDENDMIGTAPVISTATSNVPALGVRPGGVNRVRFTGIQFRADASLTDWVDGVGGSQVFALVQLEARDVSDLTHGALADMPDLIHLDRCWVNGGRYTKLSDRSLVQHCILFNTKRFAVTDSVVGGNWFEGVESHGAIGRSTQGPLKFYNTKFWGSSIPLFFGGADPFVPGLYPADVEVRSCLFYNPPWWLVTHPSYDGIGKPVVGRGNKNCFEIKYGQRYLIEGNVFDGMFQGWQNGQLMSLKTENSGGGSGAGDVYTRDVTVRYNVFRNGAGILWLQGFDYATVPGAPHAQSNNRIEFCHNVGYDLGGTSYGTGNRIMVVTSDPFNATIHHNTIVPAQTSSSASSDILLTSAGPYATGITWRDNIFAGLTALGIFGDGGTTGSAALNAFVKDGIGTPTWGFFGNVFAYNGSTSGYPGGNNYVLATADIAFANLAANNYRLTTNFLTAASDGGRPGADIDTVDLATAGRSLTVDSVTVLPSDGGVAIGDTRQLLARANNLYGNPIDNKTVTWGSSSPSVGSVNSSTGLATGVAQGSTTITATCDGKNKTATLAVGIGISPGSNIQTVINANGAGTRYVLRAGTHIQQQLAPKTGDTIIGIPGAILDGQNTTTYAVAGWAGVWHHNVTLKDLIIKNYVAASQRGAIWGGEGDPSDSSDSWNVQRIEVYGSGNMGVRIGHNMTLRSIRVHHNSTLGVGGVGDNVVVDDLESDHNNVAFANDPGFESGGTKFVKTNNLVVMNSRFHHNGGVGLWLDICNSSYVLHDCVVEWNAREGICCEISYGGVIRNNTVRWNGPGKIVGGAYGLSADVNDTFRTLGWGWNAGIGIHATSGVEVKDNLVVGNFNGVFAVQQPRDVAHGDPAPTAGPYEVTNLNVHNNQILDTPFHSNDGGWAAGGVQDFVSSPDMFSAGRNNHFETNTYRLNGVASPFAWAGGIRSQAVWTGTYGHDDTGTFL